MKAEEILHLEEKCIAEFKNSQNEKSLYDAKVSYLGRNGKITNILKKACNHR